MARKSYWKKRLVVRAKRTGEGQIVPANLRNAIPKAGAGMRVEKVTSPSWHEPARHHAAVAQLGHSAPKRYLEHL